MNPPNLTMSQVLSAQHAEWLAHPVTQQMLKNIESLREKYVKALSSGAANSAEPEFMFRTYSYGIKTADTILHLVRSTEEFVNKSTTK